MFCQSFITELMKKSKRYLIEVLNKLCGQALTT
jgi:hypothetical protein